MESTPHKCDLGVRLLAVFALDANKVDFPQFNYWKREALAPENFECLTTDNKLDNATASCLHLLHPQARRFIGEAVKHYRLAEHLAAELLNTTWEVQAKQVTAKDDLYQFL